MLNMSDGVAYGEKQTENAERYARRKIATCRARFTRFGAPCPRGPTRRSKRALRRNSRLKPSRPPLLRSPSGARHPASLVGSGQRLVGIRPTSDDRRRVTLSPFAGLDRRAKTARNMPEHDVSRMSSNAFRWSETDRERAKAILRELDEISELNEILEVAHRRRCSGESLENGTRRFSAGLGAHVDATPAKGDSRNRSGMGTTDGRPDDLAAREFPSSEADSYQRPRNIRRNSGVRQLDAPRVTRQIPGPNHEMTAELGLAVEKSAVHRERPAPAPYHGRTVVICSPFQDDRFLLSEYAIDLGWRVALHPNVEAALGSIDPTVVLVVLRASTAATGAKALWDFRRARYGCDIAYLAATPSENECQRALLGGAKSATAYRRDLRLMDFCRRAGPGARDLCAATQVRTLRAGCRRRARLGDRRRRAARRESPRGHAVCGTSIARGEKRPLGTHRRAVRRYRDEHPWFCSARHDPTTPKGAGPVGRKAIKARTGGFAILPYR